MSITRQTTMARSSGHRGPYTCMYADINEFSYLHSKCGPDSRFVSVCIYWRIVTSPNFSMLYLSFFSNDALVVSNRAVELSAPLI